MAEDRNGLLTDGQKALVGPILFEHNNLKHLRGRLSMAHATGDIGGAVSSFSILLGPAPHLDGSYVVFGEVEDGFDVLDELASVPVNHEFRPLIHIAIEKAFVVPNAEEGRLKRWQRRSLFSAAVARSEKGIRAEASALLSVMLACTLALALLGRRASQRWYQATRMLVLLVGSFGLVIALLPLGQRVPLVGGGLFLAVIGMFKLMGRFERPPSAAPKASSHEVQSSPMAPGELPRGT